MNTFTVLFTLVLFSGSAFSQTVSCKLENAKNSKHSDAITFKLGDDLYVESNGLEVGKFHYSFDISSDDTPKGHEISVIFYEHNFAQDEVGGLGCIYTSEIKDKSFCEEKIFDNSTKSILNFSCRKVD